MKIKPRLTREIIKRNQENSKVAGLNGDPTRINQDQSRKNKLQEILLSTIKFLWVPNWMQKIYTTRAYSRK